MNTTFMKITVATIIAGSTLFSGTASAATKVETTATNQYTALKAGMTMEQVAKVLYGKDYKKTINDEKWLTSVEDEGSTSKYVREK